MKTTLTKFKNWIIMWIWFSLTVLIIWITYAAVTTVSPWETLTADMWNGMVDVVNDEYLTNWTEVLTNKTWDWKPVYRKVLEFTSPSGWVGETHDVSSYFSNATNCRVVFHLLNRSDWWNSTGEQNDIMNTDVQNNCSSLRIKTNGWSYAILRPVTIVVEYTKTTD